MKKEQTKEKARRKKNELDEVLDHIGKRKGFKIKKFTRIRDVK